jgi:hypothetical protein
MKLRSVFAALLCILLAASPAGSGSMLLTGVGPPPVAGGGYTAQGVSFSATTLMHSAAALTGVADSKTGMVSFWFRGAAATDSANIIVFDASSGHFQIARLSSGIMRVTCTDSTATNNMQVTTTATFLSTGSWKHFIASWNLATATIQSYVEDVSDATILTNVNSTIAYATGTTDYLFPDSGLPGPFDVADFWFDPNQAPLDLSVTANRRKFITAGLAPVNLGAAGATPTGTSPAVFFSGASASWNTNKGTGGGFTITAGSITNASSNPP